MRSFRICPSRRVPDVADDGITELQEKVLGLLEEAGIPTATNDRIMALIAAAEQALYDTTQTQEETPVTEDTDIVDAIRDGQVPGLTIDPYNPAMAYDAMPLNTPPGTRVRFTGHGGYDRDQAYARQHLEVGAFYTVAAIEVGSWSSHVSFTEIIGRSFNTVMFERALPGGCK